MVNYLFHQYAALRQSPPPEKILFFLHISDVIKNPTFYRTRISLSRLQEPTIWWSCPILCTVYSFLFVHVYIKWYVCIPLAFVHCTVFIVPIRHIK